MTAIETFPKLPSLKKITDNQKPIIAIDTREQDPLVFTQLESVTATLYTGDYSFLGGENTFAVERKSVPDLVSCCVNSNRDRFERELHRLRGFHFARLLIVGSREDIAQGDYRSRVTPKAVLSTLAAFEARYNVPVAFCPAPQEAARQIERWAFWFAREIAKQVKRIFA